MNREELKELVCDYIDEAGEDNIIYSIKEQMYTAIGEYGGEIYKPSGIKEFSLKIIIKNQDFNRTQ